MQTVCAEILRTHSAVFPHFINDCKKKTMVNNNRWNTTLKFCTLFQLSSISFAQLVNSKCTKKTHLLCCRNWLMVSHNRSTKTVISKSIGDVLTLHHKCILLIWYTINSFISIKLLPHIIDVHI